MAWISLSMCGIGGSSSAPAGSLAKVAYKITANTIIVGQNRLKNIQVFFMNDSCRLNDIKITNKINMYHLTKYHICPVAAGVITLLVSCSENKEEPQLPSPAGIVTVEVLAYNPAPGQFVNEIPEYTSSDNETSIIKKAEDALNNSEMITLGALGGSITLRLTSPLLNTPGQDDFRVLGNSFYSGTGTDGHKFGSSEPGIVYVMTDSNGNGLPDDGEWLELRGESTTASPVVTVTYTEDGSGEISWTCSDGNSGEFPRLTQYHDHSYFPLWTQARTLSFTARRLPDNGVFNEATGRYDLYCLDGYADSHPNGEDASALDLDNAIDADGQPVKVERVDFIRVVTAILQFNGILGECSTEISGIERL